MKPNTYTSSIVSKYGDVDRVKQDVKTLNEILARQGSSLFIDVVAESVGAAVIKFNLNEQDRAYLVNSLVSELRDALNERT